MWCREIFVLYKLLSSGLNLPVFNDDDPSVTRALKRLLHSWGMQAFTFASGEEYLSANDDD
jgi:FixJ family two-component response regulator